MKIWIATACLFFSLQATPDNLFEDAVRLIKKYEG